jgi:hypothetical protein
MSIKIKKSDLQPSFRQKDLMTKSNFISYCYQYGVRTGDSELEFLEKKGLFFPAVRVYREAVEMREIYATFDGEKQWRLVPRHYVDVDPIPFDEVKPDVFYIFDSLHLGAHNWLDPYKVRGMVEYPANRKFKAWNERINNSVAIAKEADDLGSAFETFYGKNQLYALKFLQSRLTLEIRDAGLFRTPEEWVKLGESVTKMFTTEVTNKFLKETMLNYNKFFAFVDDLARLWDERTVELDIEFSRMKKVLEKPEESDLNPTDIVEAENRVDESLKAKAAELLKRHTIPMNELDNWRVTLLSYGTFGIRFRSISQKPYLNKLNDEDLAKSEDPYKIVHQLNWLIVINGGQKLTIKELLIRSGSYQTCKYCEREYKPKRIDQTNCGLQDCQMKHKNELKKEKRKAGIYK